MAAEDKIPTADKKNKIKFLVRVGEWQSARGYDVKCRRMVSITHSFVSVQLFMRSSLSIVPDGTSVTISKPALTEIPMDQISVLKIGTR